MSGATLRKLRREKGFTQEQLAGLAGVHQTTISAIENGNSPAPTWETVGRLARALDVEPGQLFPLPAVAS